MAGMVLSSQRLAEMNDANFRALKTAKGQLKEAQALNADLRAKMALMQKSIDTLTDQRTTAEGQIKRLLDLLERTQAQRDAAMAIVNVARQSRGRLVRAYRKVMQQRDDAQAVEFAAHMPTDYKFGLPSWVNQVLYASYLNWRDWVNGKVSRAEDIEQIAKLQKELAARGAK